MAPFYIVGHCVVIGGGLGGNERWSLVQIQPLPLILCLPCGVRWGIVKPRSTTLLDNSPMS